MIEVGKVVTKTVAVDYGLGPASPPCSLEWATVQVGLEGVAVAVHVNSNSPQLLMTPDNSPQLLMTPESAIELAQTLMKAAESQAEYAKSRKELQDEMTKLDETFKDRISGLGIGGVDEPEKLKMVAQNSDVIIVDAG